MAPQTKHHDAVAQAFAVIESNSDYGLISPALAVIELAEIDSADSEQTDRTRLHKAQKKVCAALLVDHRQRLAGLASELSELTSDFTTAQSRARDLRSRIEPGSVEEGIRNEQALAGLLTVQSVVTDVIARAGKTVIALQREAYGVAASQESDSPPQRAAVIVVPQKEPRISPT